MWKMIILLPSVALVAAAVEPVPLEVLARFDQMLKDPRSAQIEISTTKFVGAGEAQEKVVCGRYNSKNSYGGYIGFHPFVFRSGRGGVLYSDGVAVRSDGVVDDINDVMGSDPQTTAELEVLTRHGEALIAEVKAALALCTS